MNILLGWAITQTVYTQRDFLKYLDTNKKKYEIDDKLVDSNQIKAAIMDFEMKDKFRKLEENKLVPNEPILGGFFSAGQMARHDPEGFDKMSRQGEEYDL